MKTISLSEFKQVLKSEKDNPKIGFVDVRMPVEYKEKHIKGVQNIPLDTLPNQKEVFKKYDTVYLHCKSGTRCTRAIEVLEKNLDNKNFVRFEGGIDAWEAAGLPLEKQSVKIPIMRQVLITAGTLILVGSVLNFLGHKEGLYLSTFVGAGLVFAGVTGWCGMAALLGKMPWNKS